MKRLGHWSITVTYDTYGATREDPFEATSTRNPRHLFPALEEARSGPLLAE
jgi:hypothetical protein